MSQTIHPQALQKIGEELAIAWSDGKETYLGLEKLRRACPCATCGGEPDILGEIEKPALQYQATSFDLASWEMVGGYGWQPHWRDGHRTGIFPFSYLRKLGEVSG